MVKDKANRMSKLVLRYGHADLIAYALSVSEEISSSEPKTYTEALKEPDANK